jgi:hypothetical protein
VLMVPYPPPLFHSLLIYTGRDDPDMFVRSLPRIKMAKKVMGSPRMPLAPSSFLSKFMGVNR